MGGIHTDINGATPLKGLYAAGETACVSINGANRLGSNSLTELLVFGARAGKSAAEFASSQKDYTFDPIRIAIEEEKLVKEKYFKKGGNESIAAIRKEMHQAMEAGVGIYRDQPSLAKSQEIIRSLKQRFTQIEIKDRRMTFNTELISAIELENLLELSEVIIESALNRKESRGSHQRTDHVGRDDENFLVHTLAYQADGTVPRIEYLPVIITKWPPGERVYGK
jgi:fumarate reductase flavoprotein subunit